MGIILHAMECLGITISIEISDYLHRRQSSCVRAPSPMPGHIFLLSIHIAIYRGTSNGKETTHPRGLESPLILLTIVLLRILHSKI